MGNGTTNGGDSSTPVKVSGLSGVIAIAAGFDHSLALKSDGTIWTWGYNTYGQLGDGTNEARSIPVQVKDLNLISTFALTPTIVLTQIPTSTPMPTPMETPVVCKAELITVFPLELKLKKKQSEEVTVTVKGKDDCPVESATVIATISETGKKRIIISPTSIKTDINGHVTFIITAVKKGRAKVKFKTNSLSKTIIVRVE
mgnify:FL=1